MNEVCPVSGKRIYTAEARFTAGLVFITALIFIFSGFNAVFILVLLCDFFIRSFFDFKYSPFATAGKIFRKKTGFTGPQADVLQKIFAARLGLFMCTMLVAFTFSGIPAPLYIITSLLLLFSFLEAAFNFCMGCKIYSLLPKKTGKF